MNVDTRTHRIQSMVALGCFFVSGASTLIYEIAWVRKATLVFGSTTLALSAVLAVFFLGLAWGSHVFGLVSLRVRRPLWVYAGLEVMLALWGVVSLLAFAGLENVFGIVYRAVGDRTLLLFAARLVLVAVVLVPPTFCMGATLPLYCRRFVTRDQHITSSVGLLYGINTAGAAAGCLAAGTFLLPAFGLATTVMTAAGLNVVCAIAVALLPAARERLVRDVEEPGKKSGGTSAVSQRIAVLFFCVGFVALGLEVLWTRYLGLLIRNTVYTYTLTLTVVLTGIVIGSVVVSRFFDKRSPRAAAFGVFQVSSALFVVATMMLPPAFWKGVGDDLWVMGLLLLPPAVLSGASFPLAVRLATDAARSAAWGAGRMAAVNTMGGIAGSLCVGFLAIPALGLFKSMLVVTGVAMAGGFAAWVWLSSGRRVASAVAIAVSLTVWIAIPLVSDTRIPADHLGERGELVGFAEGLGSNMAVLNSDGVLTLEIDRWWQGENRKNHQVMAAHIPMLIHENPTSVLVVGAGTGQTPSRFLMYDIEQLDCVDIEPVLFDFVREHFDSRWMDDPRVSLLIEDGRNYIQHTDRTYDVISLEVGQIFRPGVAFFYTRDFYARARARLNPGGVVAQFVPLPFFTPDQLASTLSTFLDVFPRSSLWYNTSELLLVGGGPAAMDTQRLRRLLARPAIHDDLSYSYWGGDRYALREPEVFLSGFLMGAEGIGRIAVDAAVFVDDRPILDYETVLVEETQTAELAVIDELVRNLDPLESLVPAGFTEAEMETARQTRGLNVGDIAVGAIIRQVNAAKASGDLRAITSLLESALRWNSNHVLANRLMGDALLLQNHVEQSMPYFELAVELDQGNALAHYGLAVALHRLDRLPGAAVHYEVAVTLLPNNSQVNGNFAALLAATGEYERALRYFERAAYLGDSAAATAAAQLRQRGVR